MFNALRTSAAAVASTLAVLSSLGFLGSFLLAAEADAKPRDFGTSGRDAATLADPAAIAGAASSSSTSTTIVNVPVSVALYDQGPPVTVPDGGGGVIAVWADYRNGNLDIYAQKLNAAGVAQWSGDGVPVCKAAGPQLHPQAVSDEAGGVVVAWQDERSGTADIYAQRLNSLGFAAWTVNGVPVSQAANAQRHPVVVANGLGGAIVAWVDERGADADVYAQRLSATGAALWAADGVALCAAAGVQEGLSAVSDAVGGAIVAWRDDRGGDSDVYAQRVSGAGAVQWVVDGVPVCGASGRQETPAAIADGAGGAIVAWADSTRTDVYAQRLDGAGAPQWAADGVLVCGAAGTQRRPRLCSDEVNGALVVWEDRRGAGADIYAQRLDGTGAPQWAADGVLVCGAAGDQLEPAIAVDPTGGAVVAWSDARTPANGQDVYVQRLLLDGSGYWTADGVLVCNAGDRQDAPVVIADGAGGALALWRDRRGGLYTDIYSQRVDAEGQVPDQCTPPDSLLSNIPVQTVAVQNYRTFRQSRFYWAGVGVRGAAGDDWDIEVYDQDSFGLTPYPTCFGNPLAGSYGTSGVDFVVGNFNDNHTPPGTYGVRAWRYGGSQGATLEWDDDANQIPTATASNPTGVNSQTDWTGPIDVWDTSLLTAGVTYTIEITPKTAGMDLRVFLFSSYGHPDYYYFAPRSQAVLEMSGRWGTFTSPSTEYYGIVVTNENGVAGNYQLRVWADTPVGVGETPLVSRSGLRNLSPNPAPGRVQIDFGLRDPGEAGFEIFDMAGRRVAGIAGRSWEAGVWSVIWDGRDADGRLLSPGIYFVQMKLDGKPVGMGRLALVR
jgi:hypothetical protein